MTRRVTERGGPGGKGPGRAACSGYPPPGHVTRCGEGREAAPGVVVVFMFSMVEENYSLCHNSIEWRCWPMTAAMVKLGS